MIARVRWGSAALPTLLLAGLFAVRFDGAASGDSVSVAANAPPDAAVAAVGKRMFFDASLSGSGRISCATCHSPTYAYGPPNDRAVQLGGVSLTRSGMRSVPSLRYTLNRTPIWFHEQATSMSERLTETEPPAGGFTADGRFDHLRDQATFPLLAANEMANANPASFVETLRRSAYADRFRAAFGRHALEDEKVAYADALLALERFELTDRSFHPFTSKYDAFLDGHATLTPQEIRGKKLFDDPQRAGCEVCHVDTKGANGAHPVFTDYQFEALGVPRNPDIPANRDTRYFDLGLCGPLRHDQSKTETFCGLFKTPTLRNVATRHAFFHNGRFHTLKDALRFYVQRDTNPERWYPVGAAGAVEKFDDIPKRFRANVDTVDAPLTAKRGDKPIWSNRDIDAVAAFLEALNDGYSKTPYDGGVPL